LCATKEKNDGVDRWMDRCTKEEEEDLLHPLSDTIQSGKEEKKKGRRTRRLPKP
jgi:hypothetical protein